MQINKSVLVAILTTVARLASATPIQTEEVKQDTSGSDETCGGLGIDISQLLNITIDATDDYYGSAVNHTDGHHYTHIQRRQNGKPKDPNFPEPDTLPPRQTKIIQAIQWLDLPDCYRDCMIEKDNQFQIHMTRDDLDDFCKKKPFFMDWWHQYALRPCVKKKCKGGHPEHNRAREWYKKMCGEYPPY